MPAPVRGLPAGDRSLSGRAFGGATRAEVAPIHPAQLPIIEQAYLPTVGEVARARATVDRLETALAPGTLAGGEFVDAAMLGAARQVVAIAERYGTSAVSAAGM